MQISLFKKRKCLFFYTKLDPLFRPNQYPTELPNIPAKEINTTNTVNLNKHFEYHPCQLNTKN